MDFVFHKNSRLTQGNIPGISFAFTVMQQNSEECIMRMKINYSCRRYYGKFQRSAMIDGGGKQ